MRLSDFDFSLPSELIAQGPAKPADSCRLLVARPDSSELTHARFFDLPSFLRKGDVLVLNDTKVFPARLQARKKTGGVVEILLLRAITRQRWEVLLGGARRAIYDTLFLPDGVAMKILKQRDATYEVLFSGSGAHDMFTFAEQHGSVPTPPYIRTIARRSEYQTLYAARVGSAAAPTAGLHFTKRTFCDLKKIGVRCEYVTLHVGLGTFQTVSAKNIEDHHIHAEWAAVSDDTARTLNDARAKGNRIIAVGTTTLRTLEAFADKQGILQSGERWINIFITPGYRFRITNGLITNFHTPKSTLLFLVSALIGRQRMLHIYKIAIQKKYRFFSFGDAMFLQEKPKK